MSRQPIWKCVANLGDVNPLLHGGFFIYVDTTGVYPPECALLEVEDEHDGRSQKYTEYRCVMEQHTLLGGVLSENTFHPDSAAWYEDEIQNINPDIVRELLTGDVRDKGWAYQELMSHFGPHQFDSYPLTLSRKECEERYPEETW
jgi:hypothetical protein